jgi:hypothetical protein
MQERQLRRAQGLPGGLAGGEAGVQVVHQFRRGPVIHIPKSRDDAAGAPAQEGPREPHEALAGIRFFACAPAGGHRDELRVQWQRRDVARVKLECRVRSAQDDRRIERAVEVRGGMCGEMNMRKPIRPRVPICRGHGAFALVGRDAPGGEVARDARHLGAGEFEAGIVGRPGRGVADEQERPGRRRGSRRAHAQHGQRRRDGHLEVLDQIVRPADVCGWPTGSVSKFSA